MKTCHHCGNPITFCKTYPDPKKSYWAHCVKVVNGKEYVSKDAGNATMRQRCQDGWSWATPKRTKS